METRKRRSNRRSRLWAMALAAALACALLLGTAQAAPATGAAVMPDDASPKPVVTIQGNVVVDKGKPTGFYELALCVRTARTVTLKDGTPVSEATYAAELAAALESGKKEDRDALDAKYDVQNYPFQSAAATVHIDLDALTAVTWGAGTPVYEDWTAAGTTGGNGTYANYNTGYPRGLDLSGAVEQPDIFTNLDKIINGTAASVRLDTANPDEMTNATALVEDYDAASRTALLTLSANTTTSANVVYETETPVVVVRFAYDLDRFRKTDVLTQPNQSDFWLGLDRNATGGPNTTGQKALTFLAEGDLSGDLSVSDAQAAEASIHQTVWYSHNMLSDQTSQKSTNFYYYLGAETPATQGTGTYVVIDGGTVVTPSPTLAIPKTQGNAVLARHSDAYATTGDPDAGQGYSFFQNLLTMKEGTLRLELVNAETYRKPAGGGGTTILFYDWDDSLIGVLVVDKGDVRAEVNEYVEQNLVHPDLRASQYLNSGKVPEPTDATRADYANLLDSLERQYTYRGKYPFEVGGSKTQNDPDDATVLDGSEYPLTNKLDYAFYRRVNRITEDSDVNGVKTNYFSTSGLLEEENLDAALYPYVYGWAVVEDPSTLNHNKWQVRRDAEKLEDVWTTIGVGELANVKPGVGRTDTPIPAAGTGTRTVVEPAFIAEETEKNPVPPPTDYQYTTASTEASRYFRFADFSDIDAELKRYTKENGGNKDTLIVKAVYEPGESLLDGYNYRLITDPAYTKFNSKATEAGGAYRVQLTIERSYLDNGEIKGTTRIREPVIQQDTTADAKWITSTDLGVDHDLKNPDLETALAFTETTYTKVDVDNGEQITFSLSLAARQNKVDYKLIEQYSSNFVIGTQRSYSNTDVMMSNIDWFIPDNYNYFLEGDSNEDDDLFDNEFITKDGSHGFVLYCTLGHMLEQATKYNHGEVTRTDLNTSLDYMVARDANLRMNVGGNQPEYGDNVTLQDMFIKAATACENHKTDPAYACWDANLDCAKLTYHQMQWFILDGGTDIRTVEAADDDKLDFCHLHASCAAAQSTVPDTWDKVIVAARAGNDKDLRKMTVAAIENITSLRSNANGRQFIASADFTTAIIDAVARLDAAGADPTWYNVQYVILNRQTAAPEVMCTEGQDRYWWFDGSLTAPSLPSVTTNKDAQWNFLIQAAKDSYKAVPTLKDGVTSDWTSSVRLNLAQTPFNRNDTPDQTINRNWINLTHNLVLDAKEERHTITLDDGSTEIEYIYTHTKFPDFDTFTAKLIAAIQAAEANGVDEPTWEQLQWYIIKGTWDPNPDPYVFSETEGWWWYDGNVPLRVSSLTTLLQILEMRDNPQNPDDRAKAEAALGKVNAAFFDDTAYLRLDRDGRKKLADLGKTAADAIEAVTAAKNAGAATWPQIQYYIFNDALDESGTVNQQSVYYWWKNGGEGNVIDFSTATSMLVKMNKLMEATIYTAFGDPKAIESVDNAVGSDVFAFLRLIATTGGKDLLDVKDLETDVKPNAHADADALLADVATFKTVALAAQGKGEYELPDVTWYQLQYYVLNRTYIAATNADQTYADLRDPEKGYWWYDPTLTNRPEPPPPPTDEPNKELNGILQAGMGGTISITADQLTATGFVVNKAQTGKSVNLATTNKILTLLAKEATLSNYVEGGELKLSWVQVQYYLATAHAANTRGTKPGTLTDHATALAGLKSMGWDPTKFPAGVITE